jgi:cation transport ATPase-like protein
MAATMSSPSTFPAPAKSPTATTPAQSGLSSEDARQRLAKVSPNAMPHTAEHPLGRAIGKFWPPVPCMLEAAIVLEVIVGKYIEATIIAALLVFNAALSFFQESRAQATLSTLKSRLAMNASVERDGRWETIPAVELGTLAAAPLFALVLDLIKVPVFAHLGMAESVAISTTGGQKSQPTSTTQSAAEQSNPANAKRPAKARN